MRAFRVMLQVVVFMFFAVYLLALEGGKKVMFSDILAFRPSVAISKPETTVVPKPSPIERLRQVQKPWPL